MLARFGQVLSRVAHRVVPDPFALALMLTAVVAVAGAALLAASTAPEVTWWDELQRWAAGSSSTGALLDTTAPAYDGLAWTVAVGWASGFSSPPLLAFALQMCLVLVTGHALALSPPVQRGVRAVSRLPRTAGQAALLVAAVACLSAVVHWGLGAIVGAFLAREIGRHAPARGLRIHYPLLGAAAYAGLAVWHGGLSGSAPLKVAERAHFAEGVAGVIPAADTLFSPLNLLVTGALLVALPLLFWWMTPADDADFVAPDPDELAPVPEREPGGRLAGTAVGVAGVAVAILALAFGRLSFDLNWVNLLFLFLGLACQGSLAHYGAAIADGARGAGAIILQFPFYFGILGIMKATGMVQWISQGLVDLASDTTFPLLAFLSAGLVNLFVPSGGGQWAVQGEILLRAGDALGVDPGATVMAFSYGDAWTNMLQPFWALPLLGIMRLEARDIIGYTAVVFFAVAVIVPALLLTAIP